MVDQNWQMAIGMKKTNKKFIQHNVMRVLGITSWILIDELLPWNDNPTKKVDILEIISWAKFG